MRDQQGDTERVPRQIETASLHPTVEQLVYRYRDEVGLRDVSLWTSLHDLWPEFRISTVSNEAGDTLRAQKTLLTMYITLLDDLADRLDDRTTFEEGARLPFDDRSGSPARSSVRTDYLRFITDVWSAFEALFRENPQNDAYRHLFFFDLRDSIQAMRYSFVLDQTPTIANRREAFAIGSYNMVLFPYAGLDLMHSPGFERSELGALRELVYECQQLARIGNWVSTWRRELTEGDISSGIVIDAIASGLVDPSMLNAGTATEGQSFVEAIDAENLEASYIAEWVQRRDRIVDEHDLESVDVDAYIDGMETVFEYHLASRGGS